MANKWQCLNAVKILDSLFHLCEPPPFEIGAYDWPASITATVEMFVAIFNFIVVRADTNCMVPTVAVITLYLENKEWEL